ncbi:MAG: cell division protein ZapA [OCS116 cluster bacterium]|uniref:Cell division protein ZapA n=1 Tax=OCS116 cluster bacterium TaxID=2030921 RepID=A0A2A4Z5H1_9PROT|nr:cell division protein ZapA [OCS116 cluster bacterium]
MAEVIVTVNGRAFPISCNPGEENHISELAEYLDVRVRQFRDTGTVHGDSKLFLLAGLTAADELFEAVGRLEALEQEVQSLKRFYDMTNKEKHAAEANIAQVLDQVAERVQKLTEQVEGNVNRDAVIPS